MALLRLKGHKHEIEIPNDKARRIKDDWMGTPTRPKASREEVVDLGSLTFTFDEIRSIETQYEYKTPEDYTRPLTREERERRDATMRRIRANLETKGILKKNSKSPFAKSTV